MKQPDHDTTLDILLLHIDLEAAIAQLRPRDRLILDLWFQGYTQEEIGARVKLCQRQVGNKLEQVYTHLRRELS